MIIRVHSKEGRSRVDVEPSEDIVSLRNKIAAALKVDDKSLLISTDSKGAQVVSVPAGQPVGGLGLKHGDILYVDFKRTAAEPAASASAVTSTGAQEPRPVVKQDAIDDGLEKQPGTIKRGRDARFCKHGASGMCEYCMPLQPWDAKYLEDNKIKHMSFHAYLRRLTDQNKTAPPTSSQFLSPLEEAEMKVKIPCPSRTHESWPKGICTKCQPSAVTLQSQNFRMVDHIEFETAGMIDNFLKYWRATGYQRFGYLYGRFEPYAEVPLGVKAVVSAIYEPPQEGAYDGLQLTLPNTEMAAVEEIAARLGLVKVGMIYTDLTDDGRGKGTVICKRHADSYFLSSAECILSAEMQLKNPTVSKWSASGKFGSRFVTCVMTGNEDGGIDISTFQVSNTAMAMVRDDIIEASVEPSLVRVKQLTDEHYVPEVFYKYKNKYGIMVQDAARPTFPVEYLLVTVTHGFPQTPSPLFTSPLNFPIENRPGVETQDMGALQRHLKHGSLTDMLSDFHLLHYLRGVGVVEQSDMQLAIDIAKAHLEPLATQLVQRPSWQTLEMIMKETVGAGPVSSGPSTSSSGAAGPSSAAAAKAPWACRHCTFRNPGGVASCEMCGLPNE